MSEGVWVIGPDRAQLRWDMVDLDSQLPDDHRARLVWAFVEGLDLSEFYDRIKARDAVAGRPVTDPRVGLAVWLYATLEGTDSARAIDWPVPATRGLSLAVRGCADQSRSAGGVSPRDCGIVGSPADPERDRTDRRKTDHLGRADDRWNQEPALAKAGVCAYAGRGSLCKRKRLERIEQAVAQRVVELKSELDTDPAEPERQRKKRALQAAEQRAQRVERARQNWRSWSKRRQRGPKPIPGGSRKEPTQSLGQRPVHRNGSRRFTENPSADRRRLDRTRCHLTDHIF
jgi:hypothetical protein